MASEFDAHFQRFGAPQLKRHQGEPATYTYPETPGAELSDSLECTVIVGAAMAEESVSEMFGHKMDQEVVPITFFTSEIPDPNNAARVNVRGLQYAILKTISKTATMVEVAAIRVTATDLSASGRTESAPRHNIRRGS